MLGFTILAFFFPAMLAAIAYDSSVKDRRRLIDAQIKTLDDVRRALDQAARKL